MGGFLGRPADLEQAEADARHLRERYGPRAEAWCDFALTALQPGDPQRRSIRMIAKVLDQMPDIAVGRSGGDRHA